ncbi:MAG: hypothetical protein ACRC0V_10800 [Fusobacteriaceae bacterium]
MAKQRETFTIDEQVVADFEKLLDLTGGKKSTMVEKLIQEYLKDNLVLPKMTDAQLEKTKDLLECLRKAEDAVSDLQVAFMEVLDVEDIYDNVSALDYDNLSALAANVAIRGSFIKAEKSLIDIIEYNKA